MPSEFLRSHTPRSREVTVSVIGGIKPAQFGPMATGAEGCRRVVEVWRQKLANVLPARPDLIVRQ